MWTWFPTESYLVSFLGETMYTLGLGLRPVDEYKITVQCVLTHNVLPVPPPASHDKIFPTSIFRRNSSIVNSSLNLLHFLPRYTYRPPSYRVRLPLCYVSGISPSNEPHHSFGVPTVYDHVSPFPFGFPL